MLKILCSAPRYAKMVSSKVKKLGTAVLTDCMAKFAQTGLFTGGLTCFWNVLRETNKNISEIQDMMRLGKNKHN